ncbi:hypothetical protein R3P38DRAFT_607070 [Favolaschia claudopus]|uniref:Uncharacterized protein n=1 Tax=Favolaschia claudopus TaxID=2862362 RepID=A0AAW0CA43_9AGAR
MYRGSSIADANSLLTDSSLCSVLGVKNLRLRKHPISHKPHAILRRVESSDDSSDEDDKGAVVYFRLYSQKSFNVKAGRELLLTVASEDNHFKDRAVLFEGIPKSEGSEDISDEGTTQVEEEPQIIEEEEIISTPIMPPKMRRHWNKKYEEVSPPVVSPVVNSSVGVQVELSAVQASLEQNNVSVQVQPCQTYASVQTTTSYASRAVQILFSLNQRQLAPLKSIKKSRRLQSQARPCIIIHLKQ